ncbi:hypothetical protein G4L39_09095 [Limisphaera ngatamarikiensis]|uniref:Autotransporter domain-containing protein n=1 Tax=Limisphaera ngatamarikiensis TaxID=1324935 RepID=A0A6M1S2K3_9BACT|nr:autotransporter-associated beta strand repeat-containing protein [Limisphaera ngatamarikiensis]NGO39550.1 hypothetical protein [Limisphaera ngatamarikiensis]
MKTIQTWIRRSLLLGLTLAATAAHGQATLYWTGAGDGVRLDLETNWDPPGIPQPNDIMVWDGRTSSNLFLTFTTGGIQGAFGQLGRDFYITSNQVHAVTLYGAVGTQFAIRMNNITIEPGAGPFTFGLLGTNLIDVIWGGQGGQTHTLINNSAQPATINAQVRIRYGGGGAHTLLFSGSGDWIVNHHLRADNNSPTIITKQGPGRLIWTRVDEAHFDSPIQGPLTIDEGTVVLKSPNLLDGMTGTPTLAVNAGTLEYDAPTGVASLPYALNGAGVLKVSSGTLMLSGAGTFSGSIRLAGGTLVVNGPENPGVSGPLGQGSTISFEGGTLRWSAANTFDYSPAFSTAAAQQYKLDSGGQDVVLATALTSSGGSLEKFGAGRVILAGTASYNGPTVVHAGRLVFQGGKTGTGDITVADGAALEVRVGAAPVTPGTLTLGTQSGCTLAFDNVTSTTAAPLAANTLASAGTVVIEVLGGSFAINQSYPLLTWSSGSTPNFVLGLVQGAVGNLSVQGNTLYLNVTDLAYVWTGGNNGSWDLTTPNNWIYAGNPTLFANGGWVLFSDAATGTTEITVNAPVQPLQVLVNNSARAYTITSSGANNIGGSGGITKSGSGLLTLAGGANTYTGPTIVGGGVLQVGALANGGAPSDIGASSADAANLVLNGGTLLYNGPGTTSDRLFTLGTGGGQILASGTGALRLQNPGPVALSGSGQRVLTLGGTSEADNTLAGSLADSGGATAVAKVGSGKWVLTGDNTYTGGTTVQGILQVGDGGPTGSVGSGPVENNGSFVVRRSGTLTIPGVISGTGSLRHEGPGTLILEADNTYTGGTTNLATLQIGNGGSTGKLAATAPVENNGTLIFDSTGQWSLSGNGILTGTGNLIVRRGWLMAIGANSYTGWTLIEPGAIFQPCRGNAGQLLSSVVTNHGLLRLVRQDGIWPATPVFVYSNNIVGTGVVFKDVNNFNDGGVQFLGTNTYTGGTWIGGGAIVLGDGFTPGAGSIVGDVIFTNSWEYNDTRRLLVFNRPDDVTFPGNIRSVVSPDIAPANRGAVWHAGGGRLILTGDNDYPGGTTIDAGILQVGDGGATGSLGTGNVVNNGMLVFHRQGELTIPGVISGSGSVLQLGPGVIILGATNTYYGSTTVSNGTLIVNGENWGAATYVYGGALGGTGPIQGMVQTESGTQLLPGPAPGAIGTLVIGGDLLLGGDIVIEINKAAAGPLPPHDIIEVGGTPQNLGQGTIHVVNRGPTLAVGDRFPIFNKPVVNGQNLTIVGGGATWINRLAQDGSIEVQAVTAPPTLNFERTADGIRFSWTGRFKLQWQTNSLALGLGTNWVDYPGGTTSPVTVPISTEPGSVFFRLISVP